MRLDLCETTSRCFFVSASVDDQAAELAGSLLSDFGALGLEIRDRDTAPMPGVHAPDPGKTLIIAFFSQVEGAEEARDRLSESVPDAEVVVGESVGEDWSETWKDRVRAVTVGRLWVGPPWRLQQAPAGKIPVVIEPKMAFGTGDHPTTRLCLEAIDAYFSSRAGDSVLDVGTGTGVLAIAARKLGAGRVSGIDNDPVAIGLAQENARLNQVSGLQFSHGQVNAKTGTFDLVLANILSNTLIELAPILAGRVGRQLVLAGILSGQQEEVEAAFRQAGFARCQRRSEGEWVRLDLQPR